MLKKYTKYGMYKINNKINKKKMNELFELVKSNIEIINKGEGEVKFVLLNVDQLLQYEIENFTNINKINNRKYTVEELIKLEDKNILCCLSILQTILEKYLNVYKDIIVNKAIDIQKKKNEISNLTQN